MLEIGNSLREARSRRGLALADVEAATRIRARYLEALEQERFELLPAGPYPRSFLREYADFLGLDGDIYAIEYDLRFAPAEPELPSLPPRRGGTPLLGGWRRTHAVVVIAALVLIGVAAWRLGSSGGTHSVAPPPPTVTQARPPKRAHHPAAHPPK